MNSIWIIGDSTVNGWATIKREYDKSGKLIKFEIKYRTPIAFKIMELI